MKRILIDAVQEDWPHLRDVDAIEAYWNRPLMFGEDCVVVVHASQEDEELQQLLHDYGTMGIGPAEVIYVTPRGRSFYQDILADTDAMARIRALMAEGAKLDLFCASLEAIKFVEAAGFKWDTDTLNPTPDLYALLANKAAMREMLVEAGLHTLVPPHVLVRTEADLRQWVTYFGENGEGDGVCVKRPDGASSEGQVFLRKGDAPDEFLRTHFDPELRIIVEPAYEHIPFSVVYDLTGSEARLAYGSLQWQGRHTRLGDRITMRHLVDKDLDHRANMVGSTGMDLGPLAWRQIESAAVAYEPVMGRIYEMGYRSQICADMLGVNPMMALGSEFNPRRAHSNFPAAVQAALESRFGGEIVVLATNVEVHPSVNSYSAARSRVSHLCDGTSPSGVLFYHTPILPIMPKCGLICCGRSFEEVREHCETAEAELQAAA